MKTNQKSNLLCWVLLGVNLCVALSTFAQNRQQTIQLQAGWNAVFLEVEPLDTNPEAVFSNTPIDTVARYFPRSSPVQYISDPAGAPWNEPGWGVWYAPARPEAVVGNLHAIHGNKPYLVHSTSVYAWNVTGTIAFERRSWQADSFNLVGFGVNEQSPPTFERLLSAAEGRIGDRIYRLEASGKWQPVTMPASTAIQSGEAYWVYCKGKTDYQGPLQVKVPGSAGLDFGGSASQLDIEFFNPSTTPASVAVELVSGSGDLPLVKVAYDPATFQTAYSAFPSRMSVTVAAGQVERLRLAIRRESMSAGTQTRLLKLNTSDGLCYWIPVSARRSDLATQP